MEQRHIVRRLTDAKPVSDFRKFLVKQNILSLALAVVVGTALNGLVKSVVDGFLMPIVGAMTPATGWEKMTIDVGSVRFQVGAILSAFINFLIVAFVAWRLTKFFVKEEAAPPARACEFCRKEVDLAATRCPHCTSQIPIAG
jgi:large conductance mechanosensitive channel